jgi:very-short-patch-repair endonuclease
LEFRLLKAMRAAGLPEPLRQFEVYNSRGRLITRSDFTYTTPKRILIYADGLEFHSAIRQRIHDTRQSNQPQTEGWQVLRFLGPQVYRDAGDCAAEIRSALRDRQVRSSNV